MKFDNLRAIELAKIVGCHEGTLRNYLFRLEFSHIQPVRLHKFVIYKNVTEKDIMRLREIRQNSRGPKRKR